MTITVVMLIFTVALFFVSAATPMVRKIAIRSGFIAAPKADRAHTEPTALMGGVAIYVAAILALLIIIGLAVWLLGDVLGLRELGAILGAASLMAIIGFWDDRKPLSPRWKLLAQFVPAILVFVAGVQVSLTVFGNETWNWALNGVITVGWILFITNALNYMDNADGVAAMTCATASAFFLLIAVLNGQQLVSVLAAALLGASLGFARYNLPLPRSTIFMGDAGALFLGFMLAILGIKIKIPTSFVEITWMVPVIVLALPIFDTILVAISRRRRGVSFFTGGVDHTTHRLSRWGLTGLSVALAMSVLGGALGMVATFITQASLTEAYVVAASLVGVALYALWKLEFSATYTFRTGKTPPEAAEPFEF